MKHTLVFGGKAGQGPNILSDVISEGLIEAGYYVFYSRDYQSLIRGGHNFNVLTFSDKPVYSNNSVIDILVCLDDNTLKMHKSSLSKRAIVLDGDHGNMFFAGAIYKILGLHISELDKQLRKIRNYEENIKEAKKGYEEEKSKLILAMANNKSKLEFMNGSQAIARASIISGLEYYYAYPMTPATPLMFELGQMTTDKNNKHKVIELENEIAVINAALGSSIAGAKAMVGTSGGGFDLMTEALSLAGMAEIPIVVYLAQRPGPSTGIPTYSGQNDLNVARFGGHGEFPRVILAPGDPVEAEELSSISFYLSEKFRIPVILLSDKHLGESKYTLNRKANLVSSEKLLTKLGRFNSYESDRSNFNVATDDPKVINKNFEARAKKQRDINKECDKFGGFNIYGDKNSKKVVISWGSTKGAILDAFNELDKKLDAKFVQVLFIEPFPEKLRAELNKADKIIVVENNATSPLSQLIAEKTGIIIEDKNKILRYDGRAFFSDELATQLKERLRWMN